MNPPAGGSPQAACRDTSAELPTDGRAHRRALAHGDAHREGSPLITAPGAAADARASLEHLEEPAQHDDTRQRRAIMLM